MGKGYIYDTEKHTFVLERQDLVEKAINYLESLQHKELIVDSDESYNALYKLRTEVNKQVKIIADTRKQMVMAITGQFVNECKAIEKAGNEISKEITDRLLAYKPKETETIYKMTIKTANRNAFEKVKSYALKYGVEITEEMK